MASMTDIQVIERQGVRLITTATLAEQYGTDTNTLTQNFKRNKERYEEGRHYICLKGDDLRTFKSEMTNCHFAKNLNILYLWTERGCLLHAKSLNTDTAWRVYDELVETYFRAKKAETALRGLSPQLQLMIRFETEQNALKQRVDDVERRLETLSAPELEPAPKKPRPQGKPWSEREKDYLRRAYALGQTDTEIAADMGRTENSISSKRRALGLCDDSRDGRRWRPAEDKKLKKYYNQGISAYDIGQLLGRSLEGVEGRLHRLRKAGKV